MFFPSLSRSSLLKFIFGRCHTRSLSASCKVGCQLLVQLRDWVHWKCLAGGLALKKTATLRRNDKSFVHCAIFTHVSSPLFLPRLFTAQIGLPWFAMRFAYNFLPLANLRRGSFTVLTNISTSPQCLASTASNKRKPLSGWFGPAKTKARPAAWGSCCTVRQSC